MSFWAWFLALLLRILALFRKPKIDIAARLDRDVVTQQPPPKEE